MMMELTPATAQEGWKARRLFSSSQAGQVAEMHEERRVWRHLNEVYIYDKLSRDTT